MQIKRLAVILAALLLIAAFAGCKARTGARGDAPDEETAGVNESEESGGPGETDGLQDEPPPPERDEPDAPEEEEESAPKRDGPSPGAYLGKTLEETMAAFGSVYKQGKDNASYLEYNLGGGCSATFYYGSLKRPDQIHYIRVSGTAGTVMEGMDLSMSADEVRAAYPDLMETEGAPGNLSTQAQINDFSVSLYLHFGDGGLDQADIKGDEGFY